MFMHQVSAVDADRYLEHVIRRGPVRLADLAHHMAATGGPIEQMDGTHASLVPLWEWFVQQQRAGFPGIPENVSPSFVQFLGLTAPTEELRSAYAVEPFAHYLFELVRTYSPDAHWGLYPWQVKSDDRRNEPAVLCSVWGVFMAEEPGRNIAARLLDGAPGRDRQSRLYELIEHLLKLSRHSPVVSPSGSILTPLLDIPPAPADDPARLVPARDAAKAPVLGPELMGPTEERIIVSVGSDLEKIEQARPLDEMAASIELTAIGGHVDGAPITPELLLADRTIIVGDELVLIEAVCSGGRLRGLAFEPINVTPKRWAQLETEMRALAARLGAEVRLNA